MVFFFFLWQLILLHYFISLIIVVMFHLKERLKEKEDAVEATNTYMTFSTEIGCTSSLGSYKEHDLRNLELKAFLSPQISSSIPAEVFCTGKPSF